MREIKFRALNKHSLKSIDKTKWIYGYYNYESKSEISEIINNNSGKSVHNSTVCQFTGLKDKNGKEIYEGDIVTTRHQDLAKVIWHNDFTCFCYETIDDDITGDIQFTFNSNEIEILGNIYQNPNLL